MIIQHVSKKSGKPTLKPIISPRLTGVATVIKLLISDSHNYVMVVNSHVEVSPR